MGDTAKGAIRTGVKIIETTLIVVSTVALLAMGGLIIQARLTRSAEANSVESTPANARVPLEGLDARGHALAAGTGDHTLVVFTDFECPACRQFSRTVDAFVARNPEVRVVERHWPLTGLHPFAFKAALAATCAAQLGSYGAVRRALYDRPALIEAEEWGLLARVSGIRDTAQLAKCVRSERFRGDVEMDAKFAVAHGFAGTPTVILDGSVLDGAPALEALEKSIKR